MVDVENFTSDLDLNFFEQREFEPTEKLKYPERNAPIARNALRLLMMGWTESWKDFLTPAVFHAIFIARNSEFLREMRLAFQQGFLTVFNQLKALELNESQHEQVQLYLSNCLSLLPYSDITPYESIKIPQYLNGTWQFIEYLIKPIELTAHTGIERFFFRDTDRVFAYGLEPLFQKDAQPHLIFMGTTYPAGQGFLSQIMTDSKGFETVGKTLYRTGRAALHSWLEQQKQPVHVCGTSLGGSLSLLLAMDQGNYTLSRVDALNPAGLHDARSKSKFDHWDELSESKRPKVVIQKEGDDPVSRFGVWKSGWTILRVQPRADRKGPNGLSDHALNYAGIAKSQFTAVDAELDNSERSQRNFWLYSLGRSLIYYTILIPYAYIARPIISLIGAHWQALALLTCFALIVALTFTGGALWGALAAGVAGFLFYAALSSDTFKEKKITFAKMHDPKLPRNKDMDIYDEANSVDVELTHKEIGSYYQAMRCLVKNKPFLPDNECESKHTDLSKRALLEATLKPEMADVSVSFHTTKAKKAHIDHTLMLINQIGKDKPDALRVALSDVYYDEYRIGKSI